VYRRIRRVKCDEGKPLCQRCIKFGVKCDGYRILVKNPPPQETSQRTILPKETTSVVQSRTGKPPIFLSPSGTGFEDELAGVCFQTFLNDTVKYIAGPFKNSLWERLIPQISELEPFVRHAVIAIGALSKNRKSSGLQAMQASDYRYALTQYGKSIRGMREAIANGQHDLRKALVACLLVFCFEGMLGNQASASLHAESGLMLLHQWSTNKNPSGKPWVTEKAWKDQLLEGDLLEAFTALDSQVLIFMDHRTAVVHEKIKSSQTRLIATMPPEIYNFDLARQFWKLILNRNYHFSKQIQALAMQKAQAEAQNGEQRVKLEDPWEDSAHMSKDELLLSSDSTPTSDTLASPVKQEESRYQEDIQRWCLACQNLFAEIAAGENQREKVGAAILQVQVKMSHMMLAGTFFTSEMEYDIFLPEFEAIVSLSQTILPFLLSSCEGSTPRFNFDVGIVAALFFVASRCRADNVRKRAMDMLFMANYREGIWDAAAVAHMAKWLRELELEDIALGEVVPEEKRAVLSAVNVDLYHKRALLGALQGGKERGVTRKTMLSW
jgi:hypothetical protein